MAIIKNILVPTDFSHNSSSAINYACDLANDSKSTLHLLHVLNGNANQADVEAKMLQRLNSVVDSHSELAIETVKCVAQGRPGLAISDYARKNAVDLVVMGTHGRTGWAHLAMGSVTEEVLRESPCPVTVLGPHDGENVTLGHAVSVLADIIGDEQHANALEGRGIILKRLVETLRIPSTTAIIMFDELEDREWIRWENDRWMVIEGTEFIDDFNSFEFEMTPDSQSIDLISRASKLRATDIHIDPGGEKENVVRLRIDGQLKPYCRLQRNVAEHLISQLKTLARLDIADPFHPQEARVRLPASMANLDVRLTSVPVVEGQAVALRLFDTEKIFRPISQLGLTDDSIECVESMLREGEGLVLVTGPTGSGKTTSVYSMLETIGGEQQNIVSIEDPVEFVAPFVRQINVDLQHGLTLVSGLRTLMRMDPDVLFVGEIRDSEAATICMRAAASGKYVFSTMHTRDIASTITALRDLGVEDRSIAANLTGVINQRLVRRLCEACKRAKKLDPEQKEKYQCTNLDVPEQLLEAVGCTVCHGSGYRGRIGVFEVAKLDSEIRESISDGSSRKELKQRFRKAGVAGLQGDALRKAADGVISFNDAIGIGWIA